jgi:hypothetical protein
MSVTKIRAVKSANGIDGDLTGCRMVTWDSPWFGLLGATVQEDLPNGMRVLHPLTDVECVIPTTWRAGITEDGERLTPGH